MIYLKNSLCQHFLHQTTTRFRLSDAKGAFCGSCPVQEVSPAQPPTDVDILVIRNYQTLKEVTLYSKASRLILKMSLFLLQTIVGRWWWESEVV